MFPWIKGSTLIGTKFMLLDRPVYQVCTVIAFKITSMLRWCVRSVLCNQFSSACSVYFLIRRPAPLLLLRLKTEVLAKFRNHTVDISIMTLHAHFENTKRWVQEGVKYSDISTRLREMGIERGASPANVTRFCQEEEINPGRGRVSEEEVSLAVNEAVSEVRIVCTRWFIGY